jgi:hypothetical protein
MTVAIAAFGPGRSSIVLACDARLSYDEAIPASDDGALKMRIFARKWGVMFAAHDATAFTPVADELHTKLVASESQPSDISKYYQDVTKAAQTAYETEHANRFVRQHLAPLAFHSIEEWRKRAYQEMGPNLYGEYAMKLGKFDLGLELLGFGFDADGRSHIFEVENPGKSKSHNLRGYAAIGSGTMMALASLNRKPMNGDLNSRIYRVLDAKFSSETAPSVGTKTHAVVLHQDGVMELLKPAAIDKVRVIWSEIQKQKEPADAIEIIGQTMFRDAPQQTNKEGEPPLKNHT